MALIEVHFYYKFANLKIEKNIMWLTYGNFFELNAYAYLWSNCCLLAKTENTIAEGVDTEGNGMYSHY